MSGVNTHSGKVHLYVAKNFAKVRTLNQIYLSVNPGTSITTTNNSTTTTTTTTTTTSTQAPNTAKATGTIIGMTAAVVIPLLLIAVGVLVWRRGRDEANCETLAI